MLPATTACTALGDWLAHRQVSATYCGVPVACLNGPLFSGMVFDCMDMQPILADGILLHDAATRKAPVQPDDFRQDDMSRRLAPSACDLHACTSCRFGVEQDMLADVFEPFKFRYVASDWKQVPGLLPCTAAFLDGFPVWDGRARPDACQIFVDGSWCPRTHVAAWALAVLLRVDDRWQWAGFFSASAGSPACSDPLQFVCRSPHDAEMYAIVYALALVAANQMPTLINSDCTSAAGVAQGIMQPAQPCALSRTAAALSHLVARLGTRVAFAHVRSHQGHPLNEFVDSAANAAVAEPLRTSSPESTNFAEAVHSGDLFWLWMTVSKGAALPELRPSGELLDEVPPFDADERPVLSPLDFAPQRPPTATESNGWGLRLVTYNCLSLQSPLQREMLDQQFSARRVDVVFIQEARREACARFGASSAAEQGRFGCQIWLGKHTRAGPRSADKWIPSSLSILHSSPRALLITCCAGNQRFALLSAHGPTAKAPVPEIDAWWKDLMSILKKVPARCILCVGCDANARFETGCRFPEPDAACGPAGQHLCELMRQQSLCSNSLFDHHGNPVCTWTSPNGQSACIDYVLVPRELQPIGRLEGYLDLYDFDHQPLAVEVAWHKAVQGRAAQPRIDVKAIGSPEGRIKLQQIYAHAPVVDWEVDVDNHLLMLNRYLHSALTACFPAPPQRPRKSHFCDGTWDNCL